MMAQHLVEVKVDRSVEATAVKWAEQVVVMMVVKKVGRMVWK